METRKCNLRWDELEQYMKEKGKRLFDASRSLMFTQNVDEMDKWIVDMQSQMEPIPQEKPPTEPGIESMATMEAQLLKQEVTSTSHIRLLF